MLFLDISIVFEKVWHERIFFKPDSYGLGGELLNLFKVYFQETQHRVDINGWSISWEGIKSGVPQSLALSPLLLLTDLYFLLSMTSMFHVMN